MDTHQIHDRANRFRTHTEPIHVLLRLVGQITEACRLLGDRNYANYINLFRRAARHIVLLEKIVLYPILLGRI